MDFDILTLKNEHAADFRDLWFDAIAASPPAFATNVNEERNKTLRVLAAEHFLTEPSDGVFAIGARHDGQLIGFASFQRDPRSIARHKGLLSRFYVDDKTRGKGVGRTLLRHLLIRARELDGLEQIHLWVFSHLEAAIALYESEGFKNCGTVPNDLNFDGEYVDSHYMVLVL